MESEERRREKPNVTYWVAAAFIIVGIVWLCKNLGIISWSVFHFIVSWKMLLVMLGVYLLAEKRYVGGLALIAVGGYFLLNFAWPFARISVFYWPVIFIAIGVIFLMRKSGKTNRHHSYSRAKYAQYTSVDSFFTIENTFGSVQQAIMDEEMKGGIIRNSFGSVVLDLRRTSLPVGQTNIDITCQFGGIEIYIPSNWYVRSELSPFLGGYDDSRLVSMSIDHERVLVLRGEVSFSGVEIKS